MYLISVRLLLSIQYAGIDHQSYDKFAEKYCFHNIKICQILFLNGEGDGESIIIVI